MLHPRSPVGTAPRAAGRHIVSDGAVHVRLSNRGSTEPDLPELPCQAGTILDREAPESFEFHRRSSLVVRVGDGSSELSKRIPMEIWIERPKLAGGVLRSFSQEFTGMFERIALHRTRLQGVPPHPSQVLYDGKVAGHLRYKESVPGREGSQTGTASFRTWGAMAQ
jgi:hypothetical protein